MLLSYPYKFMSGYLYFLNKLKDKRPYMGLYDQMQNLFPIHGNSFQRKATLTAIPYILHYCQVLI